MSLISSTANPLASIERPWNEAVWPGRSTTSDGMICNDFADRGEIAVLSHDVGGVACQDRRAGRGREVSGPELHLRAFKNHRSRRRIGGGNIQDFEGHHLALLVGRAIDGDHLVIIVNEDRGI